MATDCPESSTALLDELPVTHDDPMTSDTSTHVVEPSLHSTSPGVSYQSVSKKGSSPGPRRSEPTFLRDCIELSKPRIVTMILVTTAASAWIAIATTGAVNLSLLQWWVLLAGTGLVAGSAGAANQVWERVIDTRMPRTASRPVASRRMKLSTGICLTASAGLIGTGLLTWQFGPLPAVIGAATWGLYVLIYTPMKVRTSWNTSVGAIAGALPVFMGYTAAGGAMTELAGWMLFGVLACWQYPHFMAIAWLYRRQYAEAGFQMTTTVEPTGRSAAWQSIVGTMALAACGMIACFAPAGTLLLSPASFLTSALVLVACWPLFGAAIRFRSKTDDVTARKMLRWSLVVLPAVLLVMTLRCIGL